MYVQVYNSDCVDNTTGMGMVANGSIDMVLCDLPYNVTKNTWDELIPFDLLWQHYRTICKQHAAIVLFGTQPFTTKLIYSNMKMFKYSLVWEKNKSSDFLNAKKKPLKIHEDINVFYNKLPTYNPQWTYGEPYKRWNTQKAVDKQTNYGKHKANTVVSDGKRYPTSVLNFSRVERPDHPTQKPVELCEWLINTYTNPTDTVLDNTMGVGTTALACIHTGRNFVGFESDSSYFQKAKEKIESTLLIKKMKITSTVCDQYSCRIEYEHQFE